MFKKYVKISRKCHNHEAQLSRRRDQEEALTKQTSRTATQEEPPLNGQHKKLQYNLNGSNTDGSFTVDDSNSVFSPYKILPIAQENKYLMIFFLFYHEIVCCVYLLESPHRGDSNEYTQHTIIV